ncbi:MAG TPA: anti-sigma factor [Candidatus Limnocylindrales bacterium]|nr:anti-sigma factor [Candidatus Limnocylindrales bacterium]
MTHAEARELLELAAAEPDGLERLAAGDTGDSAALAGHLAACDACREEYGRLTRAARLLRSNIAAMPSPGLRERTLARVAAEGRVRGHVPAGPVMAALPAAGGSGGVGVGSPVAGGPVAGGIGAGGLGAGGDRATSLGRILRGDTRLVAGWVGSLAAAVVIAVGLSWLVVARPLADQARADRAAAAGLVRLTSASVAVDSRPDARHVALTSTTGASGTLAFSPSTREVIVLSTDLPALEAGAEYRCWVEQNGARTQLGRMYRLSDVLAWDGEADAIAGVGPGATFGVSLVPAGGTDGQTVLTGTVAGT